jgi:voltage-gated potassium channel
LVKGSRDKVVTRDGAAYQRFSDAVDGPLLVLAILWLPVLIIPIVSTPSPALAESLAGIDYFVWAMFVVEYMVKLYLAPERWRFVRTHLIDLIVIVIPFLRPLRLARLLRILKLARVATVLAEVLSRGRKILTHKGLHFVLLAAVLIVVAAAGLEVLFEAPARGSNIHNFADAIWWAVVTVTTVGYGDRYPVTAEGRGVAVVLMLVGIGLVGTVTATVASYFVEQGQQQNTIEMEERLDRIERMLEQLVGVLAAGAPVEPLEGRLPGPTPTIRSNGASGSAEAPGPPARGST